MSMFGAKAVAAAGQMDINVKIKRLKETLNKKRFGLAHQHWNYVLCVCWRYFLQKSIVQFQVVTSKKARRVLKCDVK